MGRMGGGVKRYVGGRGGGKEIIYLSLHCHHQNDSCINCEGQSHKTVSTNHNLFEEKGEPKWTRTEALLHTSLLPYR